jgi:hypothetical protein
MERNNVSTRKIRELVDLLRSVQSPTKSYPERIYTFRERYQTLPLEERRLFFEALLSEVELDQKEMTQELRRVLEEGGQDPLRFRKQLMHLREKIESPRTRIFRNFPNVSGGLKFLLDLRADVLAAQRQYGLDLEPLEQDIARLFDLWFQEGFLFLNEITLDSPYRQIRFLKEHDLVHPMANLEEMGSRLGEDRRCYALYHRLMPEEPIIFIEVALTRGIAASIHEILGDGNGGPRLQRPPDTAVFYSINNTQNGLSGLGLGKVLIFRVVEHLEKTHPGIKTFATLSPIPGFWERYLQPLLKGEGRSFRLNQERLLEIFPEKTRQALVDLYGQAKGAADSDFFSVLFAILSDPRWIEDSRYLRLLQKPLCAVAYFYLTEEKDRQGRPLNPVANFHLGNGAVVRPENIHFAANRSPRGLMESCGIMVNYIYSQSWFRQVRQAMKAYLPWMS